MDDHFILEIDDAIPREICKDIIERFESDPRKTQDFISDPINKTTIIDLKRRDSMSIFITNKTEWADIDEILSKSITEGLRVYERELKKKIEMVGEDPDFLYRHFFRGAEKYTDSGYSVIQVKPNSWYRWHHDGSFDKTMLRCIWYLNDIDDEHGGCTNFINRRSIKPRAGKLLFFPATWIHAHSGARVTTNKYICGTTISID